MKKIQEIGFNKLKKKSESLFITYFEFSFHIGGGGILTLKKKKKSALLFWSAET